MNIKKLLVPHKGFLKKVIAITIPVALQNLLLSALNMVDTFMIGQLGEADLASVALANQVFFVYSLLLFGIASGVSVFTAQFWGKKDLSSLKKFLGIGLVLGLIAASIFTLLTSFRSSWLISLFSPDPYVVETGGNYLRIVGFSYAATAVTFVFSHVLRSTREVKLPLFVTIISLSINSIGNLILIFGLLGAPKLGVVGAAVATTFARGIEMVLILTLSWSRRLSVTGHFREYFSFRGIHIKSYFKTATPVIINEVLWVVGMVSYSAVYGRISTEAVAAYNIADSILRLGLVLFFGTSGTCAVFVGNTIGEGDLAGAKQYANTFAAWGPILGAAAGILLFSFSFLIPGLFQVSQSARDAATKILWVFSLFLPCKIFIWHMIVGVLRSGGDTLYSMFLEGGTVWIIGVPLAVLGGIVFKLPVYWVVLFVQLEEIVKFIFSFIRLRSGKWLKSVTGSADDHNQILTHP